MRSNLSRPLRGGSWKRLGTTLLLALSAMAVAGGVTIAAEEPGPADGVQASIAADAVVPDAKVTLEARRLPLSEVLAAISRQSKTALAIAPDAFAKEPRVTMAVSQMPLREWMESLATLYDARWEATGVAAFRLQSAGYSENQKGVRHMGSWYEYWEWPDQQAKRPAYLPRHAAPDWKGLVDNHLDLDAVTTAGVPFVNAPAELQQAARAAVESQVANGLLWNAMLLNAAKGPLTISVARPAGGLTVTSQNKAGRVTRTIHTPSPLAADILLGGVVLVEQFDFRPATRGRELLDDRSLFKQLDPNAPGRGQVQAPAQNGGR